MDAIGFVHTSFAIHNEVLASLPSSDLVQPVAEMRAVLDELRASGKALFPARPPPPNISDCPPILGR